MAEKASCARTIRLTVEAPIRLFEQTEVHKKYDVPAAGRLEWRNKKGRMGWGGVGDEPADKIHQPMEVRLGLAVYCYFLLQLRRRDLWLRVGRDKFRAFLC